MSGFEDIVESLALTEDERASLKAEFDWFNEQTDKASCTPDNAEQRNCTFESGCSCPDCTLINEQAEQAEYDFMVQMHTPGGCRNGRCSG
jgi:hypothetical protein